ncbi:MAG: hypothetical protein HZB65_03265 [Candidatus Aenigmarchaeota archaeon]|nr:hypothetical protein [Candidatus Aenigmarchaeota archaeon]
MNAAKTILILMMVISVIVVSGCIGQGNGQNLGSGIAIRYDVSPSVIYEGGQVAVYMDVENVDIAAVDAYVDIFNTGVFSYAGKDGRERCRRMYKEFLPGEIKSMRCVLDAPSDMAKQIVSTNVDYKALLNKQFSAPLSFDIIGQSIYLDQKNAGTLSYGQQSYSFSDPNILVSVEFSKQPPFVLREGEKVLMYVKTRSIGPGFLKDIDKDNFQLELQNQADNNVKLNCDFPGSGAEKLIAIKGEFPPITCELNIAEVYSKLNGVEQKNYLRSFMLIIKYNYEYEIRGTIPLVVNK